MTISSSTSLATFATALADNIGVGDVVIYNTGGTATATAFIHGRSSSTVYTVKTASGTLPTVVTADTSWSIYRAYTTLANAETGTENTGIANATIRNFDAWSGGADLVASNTQWNIAAYANGTTADTVTAINGWTTGQQNYIKVYTPVSTSEVGTSQRHQGKWDDNKYKISDSWGSAITINIPYIRIDGIQVALGATSGGDTGGITASANDSSIGIYISNNIIKLNGVPTGGTYVGINVQAYNLGVNYVWNNIIYDIKHNNSQVAIRARGANSYIYNNTIYNSDIGLQPQYAGNYHVKNNIVQNIINGFDDITYGGFSWGSSDYNISDIAGDAPGSHSATATVSFVDAANNDFHLASTDTVALDAGTSSPATDVNLSFTDDIDGQLRRQWDIGADEGSVEYVTSVMESGGNFSTLSSWEAANQVDLATTSTAVFSLSSASGTIPANSSVMGLTSGAVASTTVGSVSTSTQILLYNIASSTFISGERIYIKGGATTSNYAIISNAGNPAIATAKIDGAWVGAEISEVYIDGWISGRQNYIRVYTTSAARHSGKWDANKYRIVVGDAGTPDTPITINEKFVRIDGLQFAANLGARPSPSWVQEGFRIAGDINDSSGDDFRVSNNIIKITGAPVVQISSSVIYGIWWLPNTTNPSVIPSGYFYNNIISNELTGSYPTVGTALTADNRSQNTYINNNTFIGSWSIGVYGDNGASRLHYLKNNLFYGPAVDTSGSYSNSRCNYNATNLSSLGYTAGANDRVSQSFAFVDAANKDFHLSPTDTAAKDAGVDLSNDATSSFATDIDGQYRGAEATSSAGGLGWDIGADEGATIMYRSVGNTSDAISSATGGVFLTISSSTATFFGVQPNIVGVGDVLLYDSDWNLSLDKAAFITGRSSSTVYSVQSATGSPVANVTIDAYAIYRAHTLLNNWQSQTTGTVNQSISAGLRSQVLVARDLVASNTAMFVPAYASSSPDNTAVLFNTWTTGAGNYIKVYTPVNSSEVGISQRHLGKWDSTKYRLAISDNYRPILNWVNYIWFDGLQISNDTAADGGVGMIHRPSGRATGTDIKISNNIIRTTMSPTWFVSGLDLSYGAVYKVWNNILYDFSNIPNNGRAIFIWNDVTNGLSVTYLYNNTIYNSYFGIWTNGSGTTTAINNIVVGSGNANAYYGTFATGNDYNATDGTDDIGQGTHNKISQTFNFIDLANRDFHLAPTDRAARDSGVSLAADPYLPFTVDIDGNTRPYAGTWDIGADEDAASNPDYRFNGWFKMNGWFKFR
jgi:hypothetical protein